MAGPQKLDLLSYSEYAGVNRDDPIRFYYWPVLGRLYRRRVELCLAECTGGQRVLDVGFGCGVTFLNLHRLYREIRGLDLTASVSEVEAVFARRQIKTRLRNGDVLSMPYDSGTFDTVLLVSILEHLKPEQLAQAFAEIRRVLKPGGQVVYGVPIERRLMALVFRALGYDIRKHHFSTEKQIAEAASAAFEQVRIVRMNGIPACVGAVYEIGHFARKA